MLKTHRKPTMRTFYAVLASFALIGHSAQTFAWGSDGHSAIGILAISQLQPDALTELENIVNPLTKQAMIEACNWPDDKRETEEWAWSAPLHYINIPRNETVYSESRDCPEESGHQHHPQRPKQLCATQGIKHYASELSSQEATTLQRWQAFAWLCHLVGDLHQPLHAGFADDRGGNDFDVVFNNEQMNLHGFWDFAMIHQEAGSWQYLVGQLSAFPVIQAGSDWSPEMVNDWTNDSHNLASNSLYPATKTIRKNYVEQSWVLAQHQITLAASRLATIINSELQDED
jgi:hypothetical protein